MKWQVIKIRALQWLRRIVFYSLYTVLVFFIVGFSVLQIPAVQKNLINRMTRGFIAVSGFDITFDRFYLLWYDRLEITNLKITDPQHNSMIEAGRLSINFSITSVYEKRDINIDAVSLREGNVNLITIPESDTSRDLNINIFIAEINKQFSSGKGGGGQPPRINIGEILIEQSQFSYQTSKDSIKNGFDYNHFRLALDEGDVNGFQVIGDTIQFQLNSLLAKDEKTGLNVTNFSTYFRISQQSMEFLGLNMTANQSHISDTIIFKYKSQADLSDFNNLVTIDAKLKDTKLYPEDLSFFTTGVERWKEPLLVSGRFRGKVSRFTLRPMTIAVGSSLITGSLEMDGLPSIRETFITARLNPSQVYARDLAFLLPDNVNRNIAAFNKIQFKGNFTGFVDDFVADGDFETRFGRVQSDINYKISEVNIDQSSYRGKLQLTDFDLGAFLRDTINFQKVTLNGTINGKGFTKITADFKLTGSVEKIGLLGYPYTNIVTNARFANQFFNGDIKVDDPNLQFTANGSIDLRDDRNLINMEAKLDTALLHELHLSKDEIFLQSYVDIDSKGLELDSIVGTAFFKKTLLQFKDESIRFDSMRLISENEKGNRRLTLKSSLADLSLHGNYYYSTLFNDIQKLVHEFILNIKNDPVAIRQYYETKPKSTQAYQVDVKGTVHDVNALLQVLDVPLSASRETQVEGLFSTGLNSTLHVYSTIDTVKVSDQIFTANEIEFNGSKFRDSTQVLAQLTVNSERQYLAKNVTTKNLFLEGIWNKDHIDLDFDVDQEGYDNSLRLKWEVDFLKDSTILKIAPSTVKILGEKWTIDNQNQLAVAGREWTIHNLGLTNGIQSVKVDGAISHDPTKRLKVDIQHFNLAFLNLLSTEKFSGELNAEVVGRDLYADIFLENILSVDSLTVNNFFVGDIKGNNTRDPRSNQVQIDLTVDRFSYRIVDIKGFYDPEDKDNPLHTKAILEKANLKLLEPIVKDLFSQLDGTLTGEYDIQGTFTKPKITGEAKIEKGQIMINYLKTLYKVTGTLGMTPNQIQFNNFDLTDAFKNKGRMEGYIAHRNFGKMRINIDASFSNFHLLNTVAKDNSLFYGQAFGTGTLNILGPVSNLKISATARTNKNTRLSIPIGGTATSSEKKDFIQFASFASDVKKQTVKPDPRKRELSGLTMDLNIDVTPDAYAELIFDIKSGDIIRGRGRGDIKLEIDTKGEFNMFGLMEFSEGAYNFTLYDIINKEFSIKPGSRITWFGDPYEGNLAITASYRQVTSMGPILSDQSPETINDPNIRRKYPVEVLLKLDGPMNALQINFDIDAKDLPENIVLTNNRSIRLKFDFNAFKAKLDEQELKRQVFSLIILRRLSPPDAFATGGSLYNSVSELLSNQLSYWLSQVDQNLEIDFDLGTLDQEAFNTFQLRLSYSFLNGRLRVTRDGNFGNQAVRSGVSTIAGDWTVDYLLTPDGKFKVKMYSRSSVNQLQNSLAGQNAAVTTGASLLYTENFNEFKDLLRSARDRRRKELEENPPTEEKDENKGSH